MNRKSALAVVGTLAISLSGLSVRAQYVISAHSGTVQWVEGRVMLGDKPVEYKAGVFPEMKAGDILRAEDGRAEVLLTPGAFLRVSEESSFKLVSNKLTDTRLEALTGSMLLTTPDPEKDNSVTLLYKDRTITFQKKGNYRLDAGTGEFRVYEGEAQVSTAGQALTAKSGREVNLNSGVLVADKFNAKLGDEFYRWAARRDALIAQANVSAAKMAVDSGNRSSGWYFNSYFNTYTWLPGGNRLYMSPFGSGYWSPLYAMSNYWFYSPNYWTYYGGNGGYSGGGGSVSGGGSSHISPHFDSSLGYNVGARSASSTFTTSSGGSVGGGMMGSTGGSFSGGGAGAAASSGAAGAAGGAHSGGRGGGAR